MTAVEKKLEACLECVKDRIPFAPKTAVILGSGLGGFAEECGMEAVIPYEEIEGFPVSTVSGHEGRFVFGHIRGVPVVLMQGRVHYYEGYPMSDVVLPVRLVRKMGAEFLLITNAAGGLMPEYRAGDLMLLTDQISSFVPSPLIGPSADSLGVRFPDMSHIYDPELTGLMRQTAAENGIAVREGVYVQLSGPNYESPAEIRMVRTLGANVVGMSTAVEAIAAVHAGMRVCGLSCITNPAAGVSDKPLDHEDVKDSSAEAAPRIKALLSGTIGKLASL